MNLDNAGWYVRPFGYVAPVNPWMPGFPSANSLNRHNRCIVHAEMYSERKIDVRFLPYPRS